MTSDSYKIIESLKNTPLLVGGLAHNCAFDRSLFSNDIPDTELKFDQKLGHLYEQALEELIIASPSLDLIASHVQIFDKTKRTIGELDFIIFDRLNKKYIHLELAVKFYLGLNTNKGWQYPGPDRRDNWHRKLEKLESHQLQLTQKPEAQLLLKDRFDINEIEVQHLIYGCLFAPYGGEDMPNPRGVSSSRRAGRWLSVNQWDQQFNGVEDVLFIPKHLWPVSFDFHDKEGLTRMSVRELKQIAQERCAMFMIEGSNDLWFLVSDEWGTNL